MAEACLTPSVVCWSEDFIFIQEASAAMIRRIQPIAPEYSGHDAKIQC